MYESDQIDSSINGSMYQIKYIQESSVLTSLNDHRQTDKQMDRQIERQMMDIQIDKWIDRQKYRQTENKG